MMRPGTGYVIVEVPAAISSIITPSGMQLFVETKFNPEQFANVFGTVVDVPALIKSENFLADRDKKHLVSTDNDMRLVPGDKVFFHYLSIKNAKKSFNRGTYFEEDGKRFAVLPYSSLFFAVRGGYSVFINTNPHFVTEKGKLFRPEDVKGEAEYIMLNDWVLIEPIRKGQHVEYIKGYGNAIIDDEATKGLIQVISDTPYKASEGIVRACPPACGLEVGERIIFEKESDVPVEYDLCRTLDKPYWRMKLEDIVAKRTDREVQMVRDYTLIIKDVAATETHSGLAIPETAQKQPLRGKVVMVGPDVREVVVGETVIFENFTYTDFPYGEEMGVLVREEKIQTKLEYA